MATIVNFPLTASIWNMVVADSSEDMTINDVGQDCFRVVYKTLDEFTKAVARFSFKVAYKIIQ